MKAPEHSKDEEATSIVQRLINKKELTYDLYNKSNVETAEKRRLNEFYKKEELNKEK